MGIDITAKGIFDIINFWAGEESPLRSDRIMGTYTTLAMVVATAFGFDWTAAADLYTVNFVEELMSGVSGVVTSLSTLTMILGQFRSSFSARKF